MRPIYRYEHNEDSPCGCDCGCSEDSRAEAAQRLRDYRENSPYPSRLIKRRVRIDAQAVLS